jgi:hypothetical protein
LELSLVVIPFGVRWDRFGGIPVLHKRAFGNAEEVIKGGVGFNEALRGYS